MRMYPSPHRNSRMTTIIFLNWSAAHFLY